MIEGLRRRLAWWLLPNIDKDEAKHRFRLVEDGYLKVPTERGYHKGHEQLLYLQSVLGINHVAEPEPYNIDPEEYPIDNVTISARPLTEEALEEYVSESHRREDE